MILVLGRPGSGKTKKMLELSAINNIPVLCESEARKMRLLIKAEGYNLNIPTPIVLGEEVASNQKVYIDDIKRVLEVALNIQVEAISVNELDSDEVIKL